LIKNGDLQKRSVEEIYLKRQLEDNWGQKKLEQKEK